MMLQLRLVCDDCGAEFRGDSAHPYRHGDGPRMAHDAREAGWMTPYTTGPQVAYCPGCSIALAGRNPPRLV